MINDQEEKQPVEEKNAKVKIFAIINPVAGTSKSEDIIRKLKESLRQDNYPHQIHEWQPEEDLQEIVDAAIQEGYQRFIAIGGDGTFSRVASALVLREIPLGFIPTGSTNVIARDLGIPLQINRAIKLSLTGNHIRTIDAMQMRGKYYFLNIGIGFSAEAIKRTKRQEKRQIAWLAYILSGLGQLAGLSLKQFELKIDSQRLSVRASEVNITNMGLIGFEPFRWGERVHPDDGLLDVHVLRARTLVDYLKVAVNLVLRRSRNEPALRRFRAWQKVNVMSDEPLPVQGDGDLIGETPVEIKMVAKALQVILPEEKNAHSSPIE